MGSIRLPLYVRDLDRIWGFRVLEITAFWVLRLQGFRASGLLGLSGFGALMGLQGIMA